MRVSRLAVTNFKSYRGRHEIGPFTDFTAIVGENGTGKSNCFDALCFVLGATARVMRCQKLAQLINTVDPMPECATVELGFEKNDVAESVARSISRSGASSFYVKSFAEYQGVLRSLGFDMDMHNYVVFQGDIQTLALMKPKALTRVFEEASGSIEYKEEYERTEAEMRRLEIQVGQVEDQREVIAKRKKELKGECKETQQWKTNDDEMARLTEEKRIFELHQTMLDMGESQEIVAKNRERVKLLNEERKVFAESLQLSDESVASMEKSIKGVLKEVSKQKKEIRQHETKMICVQSEIEETKNQKQQLKQEIEMARQQVKQEEVERKQLAKSIRQFDTKYKKFVDFRPRIEVVREQLKNSEMDNKKTEVKNKIKLEKENIKQLNERIANDDARLQELESHIQDLDVPTSVDDSQLNQKRKQLQKLQNDLSAKMRINSDRKRQNRASKREAQDRVLITTLQKEITGVYGFVRDLYRTTRRKHDEMIMAGLGYHSHEIAVRDRRTAIECIKRSKQLHLGDATFLPISELSAKEEVGDGPVIPLRQFLEYDVLYEPLFRFVTKGVYGCENPREAKQQWTTKRWKKLVDINGTIYRSNGTITGGQMQQNNNFHSGHSDYRAEIQHLQEQIEDLESAIKQEELDLQVQKQKAEVNKVELQLYQTEKMQLAEHLETLATELSDHEQQLANLESEMVRIEENGITIVSQDIECCDPELPSLVGKASIGDLIAEYEVFVDLEREMNEKRVSLDEISQKKAKNRVKALEQSLQELENKEQAIESEKCANESMLSEMRQHQEQQETKLREMKENLSKAKKQKSEIFGKLTKCETEIVTKEQEISQYEAAHKRAKSRLKQLIVSSGNTLTEHDISGLAEKLPDHLKQAKPAAQRQSIIEGYNKRIHCIEKEQQTLHPNFKSMESLEKIKRELGEIDTNLNELRPMLRDNSVKFKLLKKQRNNKFTGFLKDVESHLQDIYATLTSSHRQPLGGNAYLSPIHPQMPFLDGIIYSVVPPMKRYRTLQYLSGGEQTLAVLSLLFAMNKVRPSPCFILDEIDSALDKTNLAMVATFLKNESKSHQIIVVSHREQVFSECDTLIGVCKDTDHNSSAPLYFPLSELLNDGELLPEPSQISWH